MAIAKICGGEGQIGDMSKPVRWSAIVGAGALLGSSLILAVLAVADPGIDEDPQSGQGTGVEDVQGNIENGDAMQGTPLTYLAAEHPEILAFMSRVSLSSRTWC